MSRVAVGRTGAVVLGLLLVGFGVAVWSTEEEEAAAAVEKAGELEAAVAEGKPASEAIEAEEAAAVDPEGERPLEDALTCLARTVYWEAKGEDLPGMEAVASVVMNRLVDDAFPDTVCGVVQEGGEDGPCQFSWWCDENPLGVEEPERYDVTMEVARRALNQELADRTDGALFFHGEGVSPDWAEVFEPTVTLGGHVFYRPAAASPPE